MKKIYMLITDDTIAVDNIFFVAKREDAEKIVEYGEAKYYETVEVLDSIEVNKICKSKLAKG